MFGAAGAGETGGRKSFVWPGVDPHLFERAVGMGHKPIDWFIAHFSGVNLYAGLWLVFRPHETAKNGFELQSLLRGYDYLQFLYKGQSGITSPILFLVREKKRHFIHSLLQSRNIQVSVNLMGFLVAVAGQLASDFLCHAGIGHC